MFIKLACCINHKRRASKNSGKSDESTIRDWPIRHIVEVKEEDGEDHGEEEAEGGRMGRATAKNSGVAIARPRSFTALPAQLLRYRFNLRPPLQMSRIRIPFRAAPRCEIENTAFMRGSLPAVRADTPRTYPILFFVDLIKARVAIQQKPDFANSFLMTTVFGMEHDVFFCRKRPRIVTCERSALLLIRSVINIARPVKQFRHDPSFASI